MNIDHALGVYNNTSINKNNKLNKNSKLMSNNNPIPNIQNTDLTNILDHDGF
jgi:hypothetical protein